MYNYCMIEKKVEMETTRRNVILYVGNGGHVEVCLKIGT